MRRLNISAFSLFVFLFSVPTLAVNASVVRPITVTPQYSIIDLGGIGPGYPSIQPFGMNDRGDIVGGAYGDNNFHAFLYSDGKMRDLGTMGRANSTAVAVNHSRQVVGWTQTVDGKMRPFVWNGVMKDIPTLGGSEGRATGINNSNIIVGSTDALGGQTMAFSWDGLSVRNLCPPLLQGLATYTSAQGITNSGRIQILTKVGDPTNPLGMVSLLNGVYTPYKSAYPLAGSPGNSIEILPGSIVQENNYGDFIARDGTGRPAVLVKGDQATTLSAVLRISSGLVGDSCAPAALNDFDDVVGNITNFNNDNGVSHVFVYSNGQMSYLDDLIPSTSGWKLINALAINNRGQITGSGDINGSMHGYLLTPVSDEQSAPANDLAITAGDGTGNANVDGVLCDNIGGMAPDKLDFLKMTLPKYPGANIWKVTLLNPDATMTDSHGYRNVGSCILAGANMTYYPPYEFNWEQAPAGAGDVTKEATRSIDLSIHFVYAGKKYVLNRSIILARPPMLLVHGINSSPNDWNDFVQAVTYKKGIKGAILRVNHSNLDAGNAPVELVAAQIANYSKNALNSIRIPPANDAAYADYKPYRLSARRVDVVAWSYGGVATRWYIASKGSLDSWDWYRRNYNRARVSVQYAGDIRKVITLGSMWRGVPLVNYLNQAMFPPVNQVQMMNAPIVGLYGIVTLDTIIQQVSATMPTNVASMEVMGIESRWMRRLDYPSAPVTGDLVPAPFDPNIAYGSVAGDNNAYLALFGGKLDPYTLLNDSQIPSWFKYLGLERIALKTRNYTDGLVPLWSSAIPGSYKIAPCNHHDYPRDPDTINYVVQYLNNATLPNGTTLNGKWSTSVKCADGSKTWDFTPQYMAPSPQNGLYLYVDGVARINPTKLKE